ncbi:MAG: nicotinamide-nucleotide adenylyltransferase [Candidatus Altiarchaeota archaeon]
MRALVLGRFQPLHLGHVRMIEYAASQCEYLTIGIGSCNKTPDIENPFTAEEREEMLKESLTLTIPYELKRIPDFGDNNRWIRWIRENIRFDAFLTNSQKEREIFTDAGLKVLPIPFFRREEYSSTEVRKRIIEGGDWRSLIPDGTMKVFEEADGINRITNLKKP